MKKRTSIDVQIAYALKKAESGMRVEKACCKMGIGDATFYVWKKRDGGVSQSQLRRLQNRKRVRFVRVGLAGATFFALISLRALISRSRFPGSFLSLPSSTYRAFKYLTSAASIRP